VVFRTVLQEYNSQSDYSRWRDGLDIAAALGPDRRYSRRFCVTPLRSFGPEPRECRYEVTTYPSSSRGRVAWQVVRLERGSWLLPQTLEAGAITLQRTGGDASKDRLILSVAATLDVAQLEHWKTLIGLQFENSAAPTPGGFTLLDAPEDAIAFTLVGVDVESRSLVFDLSRPYRRVRPDRASPRLFWSLRAYDRQAPVLWGLSEPRVLVNSDRWACDCPDYSGLTTAAFEETETAAPSSRFPLPSAQSPPLSRWETAVAGYRSRFRDLDLRTDRRRACKHSHADRWRCGLPLYEPADYPFFEAERQFAAPASGGVFGTELFRLNARRDLELDSVIVGIAEAAGILVDTRGLAEEQAETMPAQRGPILWTSLNRPPAELSRIDDWWLKRGTRDLYVWNPVGGWSTDLGVPRPCTGAPVILLEAP
jgi:hypothetical protein